MNPPFSTVLVVSSDQALRHVLRFALRRHGYLVLAIDNPSAVSHLCANIKVHLVVIDDDQEGQMMLQTAQEEVRLAKPVELDTLIEEIVAREQLSAVDAKSCA